MFWGVEKGRKTRERGGREGRGKRSEAKKRGDRTRGEEREETERGAEVFEESREGLISVLPTCLAHLGP